MTHQCCVRTAARSGENPGKVPVPTGQGRMGSGAAPRAAPRPSPCPAPREPPPRRRPQRARPRLRARRPAGRSPRADSGPGRRRPFRGLRECPRPGAAARGGWERGAPAASEKQKPTGGGRVGRSRRSAAPCPHPVPLRVPARETAAALPRPARPRSAQAAGGATVGFTAREAPPPRPRNGPATANAKLTGGAQGPPSAPHAGSARGSGPPLAGTRGGRRAWEWGARARCCLPSSAGSPGVGRDLTPLPPSPHARPADPRRILHPSATRSAAPPAAPSRPHREIDHAGRARGGSGVGRGRPLSSARRAAPPGLARRLLAPTPPRRVLKGASGPAGLCPRGGEGHAGGGAGGTAGELDSIPFPSASPGATFRRGLPLP